MIYHHLPDDVLVTPFLQQRLQDEADLDNQRKNNRWLCGVVRSNGEFMAWSNGYEPEYAEKLLAEQMVRFLNRELAHDGAWVVEWVDYGRRFVILWMDHDGDVNFTMDIDDDVVGIVEMPLTHWAGQAEEAWQTWHKIMRDALAPRPEQLFRRSLGEKPLSFASPGLADTIAGLDRTNKIGPIKL